MKMCGRVWGKGNEGVKLCTGRAFSSIAAKIKVFMAWCGAKGAQLLTLSESEFSMNLSILEKALASTLQCSHFNVLPPPGWIASHT